VNLGSILRTIHNKTEYCLVLRIILIMEFLRIFCYNKKTCIYLIESRRTIQTGKAERLPVFCEEKTC